MCEMCDKWERIKAQDPREWTGQISQEVLGEVISELDIKWPVRIKPAFLMETRDGKVMGQCRVPKSHEPRVHDIEITRGISVGEATHTLLHELRHAKQHEVEDPDQQYANYVLFNRTFGYEDNPYEVEAEEFADKYFDQYPIAL